MSFDQFFGYLESGKVDTNNVIIESQGSKTGRILKLNNSHLKGGDRVLEIPESLLLSIDIAKQNAEFMQAINSIPTELLNENGLDDALDNDSLLGLFLLYLDCQTECKQKPHMDVLPHFFPTHPTHLKKDILDLLKGTVIHEMANVMLTGSYVLFDSVVEYLIQEFPNLFPKSKISLERLLWAVSIITSRSFLVRVGVVDSNGNESGDFYDLTCIAPLADMANHSNNANMTSFKFDSEKRCLVLSLDPGFNNKESTELTLHYGDLPNWQLFLYYGFVIPGNNCDFIEVPLEIPEDTNMDLTVRKTLLFDLCEICESTVHVYQNSDLEVLLASMRLIVAIDNELEGVTVHNVVEILRKPLSERNEKAAIQTLISYFNGLKNNFVNINERITLSITQQPLDDENRDVKTIMLNYLSTQIDLLVNVISKLQC